MLTQIDLNKIELILEKKLSEKFAELPTREEFYKTMNKLMNEIKAAREELSLTRISHYHSCHSRENGNLYNPSV